MSAGSPSSPELLNLRLQETPKPAVGIKTEGGPQTPSVANGRGCDLDPSGCAEGA